MTARDGDDGGEAQMPSTLAEIRRLDERFGRGLGDVVRASGVTAAQAAANLARANAAADAPAILREPAAGRYVPRYASAPSLQRHAHAPHTHDLGGVVHHLGDYVGRSVYGDPAQMLGTGHYVEFHRDRERAREIDRAIAAEAAYVDDGDLPEFVLGVAWRRLVAAAPASRLLAALPTAEARWIVRGRIRSDALMAQGDARAWAAAADDAYRAGREADGFAYTDLAALLAREEDDAPPTAWCPDCGAERADYEGEPTAYLPACPGCGSEAAPRPS